MSLRLYVADANVSQWGYVQQFILKCGCEIEVENDDAQPEKKQASVTKFSNILRDEFFFSRILLSIAAIYRLALNHTFEHYTPRCFGRRSSFRSGNRIHYS